MIFRGVSRCGVLLFFVGGPLLFGDAEAGLFSEGNRLAKEDSTAGLSAEWVALTENLQGTGDRLIEFEEKRFFPALETTASLSGRIRYSPSHGLSLEYAEPQGKILIFDERGVVEREAAGGDRELPARRARLVEPFSRFLLNLLRGNLAAIHEEFSLFFHDRDEAWSVGVRPADWRVQRHLSSIILYGTGSRPGGLLISLTDGNRQEITFLSDSEVPFTEDEREAFFR